MTVPTTSMSTIRVAAWRYEDSTNCLRDAAHDLAERRGLRGWHLNPRWENNQREYILLDIPTWAVRRATDDVLEAV